MRQRVGWGQLLRAAESLFATRTGLLARLRA
jgi:hypothetical protein